MSKKPLSPAVLAKRGDVTALAQLTPGREAYKWLCAASDFGHDEAEDSLGDVLEVSDLRYDDSRFETAAAHWELATAYLEGTEGLPRSMQLAAKHLEHAFEQHRSLEAINAGTSSTYSAEPLLGRLDDQAKAVLQDGLTGNAFNRALRQLEHLRTLQQISSVPEVMLFDQRRALRRTIAELCPLPDAESVGGSDPLNDEIELLEQTLEQVTRTLEQLRAARR